MNRFFRSALFPLIVIVLLVYLASQTLIPHSKNTEKKTYSDLITQVRNGKFVEIRADDKSGPKQAPDFWNVSVLFNWWDYYCDNRQYFPDRSDIDTFVTTC